VEKLNFKTYLEEIKKYSRYNFCGYSENSIYRRLEKVLTDKRISLEELLDITKKDQKFVDNLVDEITVNTTDLFRDPDTWVYLYNHLYKKLISKDTINVWHAGCSTGQEVYSSLILFNELGVLDKVNVIATDLNSKVLKTAQNGEYSYKINKLYSKSYKDLFDRINPDGNDFSHYFDVDIDNDLIKVKDFLRKVPKYKRHDLVEEDIPFYQKFDVIFCRNVMIYFDGDLQLNVVRKFFDKMNGGASLILGSHESLHGFFKTRFTKKGLVYTKTNTFHYKYK